MLALIGSIFSYHLNKVTILSTCKVQLKFCLGKSSGTQWDFQFTEFSVL